MRQGGKGIRGRGKPCCRPTEYRAQGKGLGSGRQSWAAGQEEPEHTVLSEQHGSHAFGQCEPSVSHQINNGHGTTLH